MNYILFDGTRRDYLLPLTFTRPIADLRVGIMTMREKWEHYLKAPTSTLTEEYLSTKFPLVTAGQNVLINASVIPTEPLVERIRAIGKGETLAVDDVVVAMHLPEDEIQSFPDGDNSEATQMDLSLQKIENSWDIFAKNDELLRSDFELLTRGRKSMPIDATNRVLNPKQIFIEEGARVRFAILNAEEGPIYIGKDAIVMEGAKIRGPFAMGYHSTVKMDAKIYGATTLGPHVKVGGELNNVVFLGYANKAHDGFLGNSVIGEWCNIGADTNNSNLKNTYDEVKLWSYPDQTFVGTGLQFCGMVMGDHTKCGINTMFNTGTVVGVNANIYGSGFQRNFIPSFTWGGTQGHRIFEISKAFHVAKAMFERRGLDFDQTERDILHHVYLETVHHSSI